MTAKAWRSGGDFEMLTRLRGLRLEGHAIWLRVAGCGLSVDGCGSSGGREDIAKVRHKSKNPTIDR